MSGSTGNPAEGPFRVVELSNVCDTEIEDAVNRAAAEGYRFDTIQFVTPVGNRRPSLAFLFFTRASGSGGR